MHRSPRLASPIVFGLSLALVLALGCRASSHATRAAELGRPVSSDVMRAALAEPGPVRFERVIAADWVVDRAGLINLDHERARAAGLEDGPEPIEVYFYVLEHPRFGVFLVDSGAEAGFVEGSNPRVSAIVSAAMNTEALEIHTTTADWLAQRGVTLSGVFLTHTHLDHIMGLPDVPDEVPIYTGPGEPEGSDFLHLFTRGTIDRMLAGKGPLREWGYAGDAGGRFAGVVDVFGDGSVFALHVPGHTLGSTAFVVRSTDGPKLLVGDASHTAWGWENGVEPGTFSLDRPRSAESLAALRTLAAENPALEVHLGHQRLDAAAVAAASAR